MVATGSSRMRRKNLVGQTETYANILTEGPGPGTLGTGPTGGLPGVDEGSGLVDRQGACFSLRRCLPLFPHPPFPGFRLPPVAVWLRDALRPTPAAARVRRMDRQRNWRSTPRTLSSRSRALTSAASPGCYIVAPRPSPGSIGRELASTGRAPNVPPPSSTPAPRTTRRILCWGEAFDTRPAYLGLF